MMPRRSAWRAGGEVVLAVGIVLAACDAAAPSPSGTDAVPASGLASPPSAASAAPTAASASASASPDVELLPVDQLAIEAFPVPPGSHPHDVAPAADGGVWYTAQATGELGWLDPDTGEIREVGLGQGSAPHGVIVGPDGAPWITDSGLNAIVRVDPETLEIEAFPLPIAANASLNTAAFDVRGILWFTGQAGFHGSLDPASGEVVVHESPQGPGPYGITGTAAGHVFYASLGGSHLGHIDPTSGEATVIEPPTPEQGARRAWTDSDGRIWISEWNVGQLGMYDPEADAWREWPLPGDRPMPYAVFVDDRDVVWLSDFGANALVRFDPADESFAVLPIDFPDASVRQLLGRPGEVWGAGSAVDQLLLVRTTASD